MRDDRQVHQKGDGDMKRSLCGSILVSVITPVMPVHAQNAYVGVIGGLNFADLKIEFADKSMTQYDVRSRTLFGVGGFVGMSVNDYLSFQIEPSFLRKGGTFTRSARPDMRIESSHLEFPLLVKAGIGESIRPYIIGGVSVGFLLKARLEVELAGLPWVGDLKEILKNTEYGVVFGAGIRVPVWKGSTFVEGRYALGLTNLNKGGSLNVTSGSFALSGIQTDPRDEIKTKGMQVMVGYQLPLGAE
jgi:hypothetical protein